MKNTTTKIITMLIGLSILLSACENSKINPSSNITTQDRTIEDYSGIEVSTVFTVDVTFSATEEKIEIETNENLHAYIDVVKSGDNLVIKLKDNTNIQGKSTLKAHITTGNPLAYISVRDASLLTMNNEFVTQSLEVNVDDAGKMFGNVVASSMLVYLGDASALTLEGSADKMTINASGASDLSGMNMIVKDVVCCLQDATDVGMTVNDTIDLVAKDASIFTYRGDAVITDIDLQDAARIVKID